MKTRILYDEQARVYLQAGVDKLAKAVITTLGPRGRNVAIAKADPRGQIWDRSVIHDGVNTAKSIELEDEFENMGAQLLKQAAQKQVQDVGDGTTVSVVLAQSILSEYLSMVAAGHNPMGIRAGLEAATDRLITMLKELSTPITTLTQLTQIATISAEDESLGQLVAQTIHQMGPDGLVAVEESKGATTTVEHQEGMQLGKGFAHPYFVNNPERGEAILEFPLILSTDREITNLVDLLPLLEQISKQGERLVILTPHIGEEALAALIDNKLRGTLQNVVIPAPSFGRNQQDILSDIALYSGGTFITKDAGRQLKDITYDDLGRADYVTVGKSETLLVGGKGQLSVIQQRIQELRQLLETEPSEFERSKLEERLAKLTSGVAVIRVGGSTEVEMKERVERVKDAVAATKAAQRSGIVPGGEIVYLQVRAILGDSIPEQILFRALEKPLAKLVENAGFNPGRVLANLEMKWKKNPAIGMDVTDGTYTDMLKSGIVDPVAVPINALQNAVSVAVQLATTGAIIIPIPEEK